METNGLIIYAENKCPEKDPMTYEGTTTDHKWNGTRESNSGLPVLTLA